MKLKKVLVDKVDARHTTIIYQPRYKICVSGSAESEHCAPDAEEKAEELGRLIAERGMVLVTGATTGLPYWSAKGAKQAGGIVIGFSPAASQAAHIKTYRLPTDYHDLIVYTGFEYSGRNLILTRAADAVITVCGRLGTLNEFTIAFEDQKVQGVLTGTGGLADMAEGLLVESHRGKGKVVFDSNPGKLLDKVVAMIKADEKKG
ncbi:MAG: LOG family protein [Candidatus Liptonbacteria bacterium]|nr:LOG family protein [Candidatus Liptonbacteria bacterium]